jgi:hypothetical protein
VVGRAPVPVRRRVIEILALVAIAAWCAQTATAYLVPSGSEISQLSLAGTLINLKAWGVAWIVTAVIVAGGIWSRTMRIIGLSIFVGMNIMWAASFLEAWAVGTSDRAWVSAKNYGLIAALGVCVTAWTGGGGRLDADLR